jgi:hypothetical protein
MIYFEIPTFNFFWPAHVDLPLEFSNEKRHFLLQISLQISHEEINASYLANDVNRG